MKLISVVTPAYNEEENVQDVYLRTKAVFDALRHYRYEHIFIDNASTDRTVEILKEIAHEDKRVKIIVNTRNFGHIRSPYYGLLQAQGDAAILLFCDLQDPPELLKTFLEHWEQGKKMVLGVKTESNESAVFFLIRKLYYHLVTRLSGTKLVKNFTGFGLYDQSIIKVLRTIEDPYPYFRGLVLEVGPEPTLVPYHQEARKRGISKNNFYTLYDIAMLGITSHSKVPIRIATMLGFLLSGLGFLISLSYLIAKLLFWDTFPAGMAPILIGGFTFLSVQLFFIGLLGEYIASIHTIVISITFIPTYYSWIFPKI
jgi:glycosyltransferase involved in cell wall biosynthesis